MTDTCDELNVSLYMFLNAVNETCGVWRVDNPGSVSTDPFQEKLTSCGYSSVPNFFDPPLHSFHISLSLYPPLLVPTSP